MGQEHPDLRVLDPPGRPGAPTTHSHHHRPGVIAQSIGVPGGYTLRQKVDTVNAPLSRVYTRDSDGATVLSDTVARSAHGQVLKRSNSAEGSAQVYRYDGAGRLTDVQDSANGVCTARRYTYDKHSNRTSRTVAAGGLGQSCPTSGGTTTTHAHDAADRLVDAGYGYDAFGRTTTVPGGGALEYFANDLSRQQVVGGTRLTLSLDAALRFRTTTTETDTNGTWGNARTKVNHYSCDCDKPAWSTTGTQVVRHVNGVEEGLSATTGKTGDVRLQLTSVHGDVSVVLPLSSPSNPVVQATDEFGNPRDPAVKPEYGWLGGSQRAADTPGGLVLMGVRLYAPGLGRFLQVDPVRGGSDNDYEYGEQDPVNNVDLDGRASRNLTTGYSGMNRYERARCAWSPGQCGTYLWISSWAMSTARMYYPRWERGQNAFRHCIWQALLVVYMGWGNAVAWGDAHEGDDRSSDHWTDLYNNSWGRWAGSQVRWWQTMWAKDIVTSKCYWLLNRGHLRTW